MRRRRTINNEHKNELENVHEIEFIESIEKETINQSQSGFSSLIFLIIIIVLLLWLVGF